MMQDDANKDSRLGCQGGGGGGWGGASTGQGEGTIDAHDYFRELGIICVGFSARVLIVEFITKNQRWRWGRSAMGVPMSPSRAILGAGVQTSSAAKVGLRLLVILGFWSEGLCK